MASRDEVYQAIRSADAAGDSESVRKLGDYLKTLDGPDLSSKPQTYLDRVKNNINVSAAEAKDAVLGGVRGAAGIGATLVQPLDAMGITGRTSAERRAGIDEALGTMGADKDSLSFKTGKLATEVAGTAGAGGLLGRGVSQLAKWAPELAPKVANALSSAGFSTGAPAATTLGGKAADLAVRAGGGAAAGGASMALIDPSHAGTGALVGAALPPAAKVLGAAGEAVGRNLLGGEVSSEVAALAQRAKDKWGIDIPADRIANSKPLNALASSLNYVPLSGRQAVESRMQDQMNRALTSTFGQDSTNVTMALRKAEGELGGKFERTLSQNNVKVDDPLLAGLGAVEEKAQRELGADGFKAIKGQIDEILAKGQSGQIDGQAAYNIKRDLDRIGKRSTPEAWHAIELKKELMGALDRSLGPEEAAAFKTTRQQYGNMLDLQKLAPNGAEGDISIARVANMKHIGNPDMQELADIAAQFLKGREGAHGAAQRVYGAGGAGATAALLGLGHVPAAVALGGTMATGRAANAALDSNALRNLILTGQAPELNALGQLVGPAAYRAVPRQTDR